jgi:D-alanyl-D-alanine carboxypeptidase
MPELPTESLPATVATRLESVLNELVTRGAPDAIGAVITPDGIWSGAAGVDGPNARKATPHDEFSVASVSKPMLAALILRLAQDGELDLDAPLSSYLGDLAIDTNGTTVRQALAMRSGIGDTSANLQEEARADCAHVWSRTEVLRSIPEPHGSAGATFEYSNPTYKLLGYAAEHLTGQSLETAFNERLFAPFGLDRVLVQGPARATPKPWALPMASHSGALDLARYGVGGTLPCLSLSTFSFATSAVASDAPSLARWGWALFSGKLLDRNQLVAMTTVDRNDYGLGIERLPDFAPDLAYGTHGGQVGYAAFLAVLPARQTVVVAFVNDEDADVQGACRALARALTE